MIAVGFLVAYDFEYLKYALPSIYAAADKIILAIDLNRNTLTGEKFHFDDSFKQWVQHEDVNSKIEWLEKPFYQTGQSPLETIMYMRNQLLDAMRPADWYIQIDADEYFLDFSSFVNELQRLPCNSGPTVVYCYWKTIFKKLGHQYLLIAGNPEAFPVATNRPFNTSERNIDNAEKIQCKQFVLHQSWARSEQEIAKKINSWSHAQDFDTVDFFHRWQAVNGWNYKLYRYFHPLHAPIWPYLERVQADSIPALIEHYRHQPPVEQPLPALSWPQKVLKKILGI
ncbi:hypothetical protein [Phnomibacter ginsenosidimutans]|uniref:Glycosyltransferase family 2 protein n=1 Tax=Phnomibacter ginsenosidimutans TaxID=2676868 RepID=A0A6I6GX90_9BACT|nr:hypothetical protein [Phnomibacter ginsenosidimutans]QGW29709.1 hypothetical protein GLV81_17725 [Phnomibacter ginsenosidimutans]